MPCGLKSAKLPRQFSSKLSLWLRRLLPTVLFPAVTVVCVVLLFLPEPTLKQGPVSKQLLKVHVGLNADNNNSLTTPKSTQEASSQQPARHHVFFLKVHKAASTTVQNVLFRFALRYNLTVLLPRRGHQFSEKNKNYFDRVLPLNHTDHYDVLCCHLVYNETFLTQYMPRDTLYIGIVREPFSQMHSAFFYYWHVFPKRYLRAIPGPVPFLTYLEDPSKWENLSAHESFTNNRMSFDFGLDPNHFRNPTRIEQMIAEIDKKFHLVMINELFDESLVFLKRMAGWNFNDIIYVKANSFNKSGNYNITEEHRRIHRDYNKADYALYEHFLARLKQKVADAGSDFAQEVSAFRKILSAVWHFCNGPLDVSYSIHFESTHWSEKFDFVVEECVLMKKSETSFVHRMKLRHIGLLN